MRDSAADRRVALADSLVREAEEALESIVRQSRSLGFFMSFDPSRIARRLSVPALVLHGTTDRQVSVDQAAELADALGQGGAPARLAVLEDLDHLLLDDPVGDPALYLTLPSREMPPRVVRTVVDWLAEVLGGIPAAPGQAP